MYVALVDPELQAACVWCCEPARVAVAMPDWHIHFPYLSLCMRHWRQYERGERRPPL